MDCNLNETVCNIAAFPPGVDPMHMGISPRSRGPRLSAPLLCIGLCLSLSAVANAAALPVVRPSVIDALFLSSFEEGEAPTCATAPDQDQDGLLDPACIEPFTPPDPAAVAPPLDPTVITDFSVATAFLVEGDNAIQRDAEASAFQPYRVAVMRGIIHDENGQPLPDVLVRSLAHPEYGYTYSRNDGAYDFRINGGGDVTLDFQKPGFIHAQRTKLTPWKDWLVLDDITLIAFDSAATIVTFGAASGQQVHRASTISDADGSRTATLIVPPGTEATLRRADGSSTPASSLTLRATEFTVGPDGPNRMPATLPETSGYTYAVELSADEAVAQGARSVEFSQPISYYLENFLNFPVGTEIPVGYYDYIYGSWLPSDNGRVIKILANTGLTVELDVDGSGTAADQTALDELGIDFAELTRLAALYAAGQELWRVQMRHLTPWDGNYPYMPPRPLIEPGQPAEPDGNGDTDPNEDDADDETGTPGPNDDDDSADDDQDPTCETGSVIELENGRLREFVPITGTPLSLAYHSARVPSVRLSAMTGRVAVTPATVPSTLQSVEVSIKVGGRSISSAVFPPLPNLRHDFVYDGLDAYSRPMQGRPGLTIEVTYLYPLRYVRPEEVASISWEEYIAAWASPSGLPFGLWNGTRGSNVAIKKEWPVPASAVQGLRNRRRGIWDARGLGNGGWSFDQQHVYDPERHLILKGDGSLQKTDANASADVPTTIPFASGELGQIAGPGASVWSFGFSGDFRGPAPGQLRMVIARTGADGSRQELAANCPPADDPTYCAAGSTPAFDGITAWVVDQDDNFIFADNARLLRVRASDGALSLIRDSSIGGTSCQFANLRVHDRRIYHSCQFESRVAMIWPNGTTTALALGGGLDGEDIPVVDAAIGDIGDLQVDANGNVMLIERDRYRIRRIGADGRVRTIAGNGSEGIPVNRSLAVESPLPAIQQVITGRDGSFYLLGGGRVFQVRPSGEIETVIGGGTDSLDWSKIQTARNLSIPDSAGIAELPDGSLILSEYRNAPGRMLRIANGGSFRFQGNEADYQFPSEDGRQVFVFSPNGRHLETRNATTGGLLFRFHYDANGRLIGLQDGDGNLTQIARNGAGKATAVQSPDGQQSFLTYNADGYLMEVRQAENRIWRFDYDVSPFSPGLLTRFEKPNGQASVFTWDQSGRLLRDTNAEGGFLQLYRTNYGNQSALSVSATTAEGRLRSTWQNQAIGRVYRQTGSFQNGSTQYSETSTFRQFTTNSDNSKLFASKSADPRFGFAAPISSVSLQLPNSAQQSQITRTRAIAATPLGTQLGQLDLQNETRINLRQYLSNYDAASRTWSVRSPMGRETQVVVDAQERPLQVSEAGLAPLAYAYDPRGRLIGVSAGSGAEQRNWSFTYDANGYLATISDPLARLTTLTNDAAGRTLTQTLPDGRAIGFQYDANSNVTAVIPPGRPAHGFVYNRVDQVTAYQPPALAGIAEPATSYSYNLDQIVTGQSRQGTVQLSPQLNPATGLAVGLTTPQGQYDYVRDSVGRIIDEQAPGAIRLRRGFNGPLLVSEATDQGSTPQAAVGYQYDANFWLSRLQVAALAGSAP
ncbi:MAG: hypothetical protein AB7K73_16310, partial [Gammaproteobacteria bacterium]